MTTLTISRARLRRDTALAALAKVLVPEDAEIRAETAHKLVWSLFADRPDRLRDYLWREESPGQFVFLSERAPADPHALFDMESKPFRPALAVGDQLGFTLRVNATVDRGEGRHDVVMDALYALPPAQRAAARPAASQLAAETWMTRQGELYGFSLEALTVDGYDRVQVPRQGKAPMVHGVLDLTGVLTVTDPEKFGKRLREGFGRAKAYGYGLMLVRRLSF
jgi:CRISPR system Cascade subunit CasE